MFTFLSDLFKNESDVKNLPVRSNNLFVSQASISAYLCGAGAAHYLHTPHQTMEAIGLMVLACFLCIIYIVWVFLSLRFHLVSICFKIKIVSLKKQLKVATLEVKYESNANKIYFLNLEFTREHLL